MSVPRTFLMGRGSTVAVILLYGVVAAALFAPTFGVFFVSDDFEFLAIVAAADGVGVIFAPLVERFVRPLVVLMYYVNYQTIGLAPWGYHMSVLFAHVTSAVLTYLVARRLDGGRQRWAFLAGLLFLVFSGHSEAVTWPAGVADPAVTVCLLAAFYCYLRALEPAAPAGWLAAMFGGVLLGTLAKEMWVTFPGWLVAHAAVFRPAGATARRRALVAIAGTGLLVVAYVAMRQAVFGTVAGGYAGLGSSLRAGIFDEQARAFVLRSFVPADVPGLARVWDSRLDLLLWPVALAVLAWRARRRDARLPVFAGMAFLLALVPVLPLTISLTSTESERFIYLPSAFSCLFLVTGARTVLPSRAAIALCLAAVFVHGAALVRANAKWDAAGTLAWNIIHSYADVVLAEAPGPRTGIFILNLPDHLQGAYVFRNGFYPAIQLVRPEVAAHTGRTVTIASQAVGSLNERVAVTRLDERTFRLDLETGRIVQDGIPSGLQHRILRQSPHGYDIEFSDAIDTAFVLYLSGGRLHAAGVARGPGVPFGVVDLPGEEAACEGDRMRFAGWALDNVRVARVTIEAMSDTGAGVAIGEPAWMPGERPDVALAFGSFPHTDRAGWEAFVPCRLVAAAPGGRLRVRVAAHDGEGHTTVLGERTVHAPR